MGRRMPDGAFQSNAHLTQVCLLHILPCHCNFSMAHKAQPRPLSGQTKLLPMAPRPPADDFRKAVMSFVTVIVLAVPLFAVSQYVEGRVVIEWRRWLAEQLLVAYFAGGF